MAELRDRPVQIEITPAMARAGADALEDCRDYFLEEVVASRVYTAMRLAQKSDR